MFWSKYSSIEEIRDNLYCLISLSHDSNIYIVRGVDELMIIDTGLGMSIDHILREMNKVGLNPRDIRYIVNTHCHIDHVGGDLAFKQYSPDAKMLVHDADAKFLIKGDPYVIEPTGIFGYEYVKPIKVDVRLKDGDKLRIGDYIFRVIHTPGHTIGSICLYDEEYKILISGDTVFLEGVGRWDLPTSNYNKLVQSIEKLTKLDIEFLLPGHGPYTKEKGLEFIKENLRWLIE